MLGPFSVHRKIKMTKISLGRIWKFVFGFVHEENSVPSNEPLTVRTIRGISTDEVEVEARDASSVQTTKFRCPAYAQPRIGDEVVFMWPER